jgi:hypothetical protein
MAVSTAVRFTWGGAERCFALPNAQMRDLQKVTGVGPAKLLQRLFDGEWFLDDLRETVRQGLIGGGEIASAADKLMADYFDPEPKVLQTKLAQAILGAWLLGVKDAPKAKKARAGKSKTKATTTAADASLSRSGSDSPQQ